MRGWAATGWFSLGVLGLLPMACKSTSATRPQDASPEVSDGPAETGPEVLPADRTEARADSNLADSLGDADGPWVDVEADHADTRPDAATGDVPTDASAAETPADVSIDASIDALKPADLVPRDLPLDGAWPGSNDVTNASIKNAFGNNLSGLIYQPAAGTNAAILWAVQNDPSRVFRLTWNGTAFAPVTMEGWGNGKNLVYPSGKGRPDSEALTRTEWDKTELYVASEHDTDAANTSRLSILRYDLTGSGTTLTATHEWNLTADLPQAEPNLGLEAIAWIPDTFLVERGFYDERAKATYSPDAYANHGTGIFLVGVEGTGMVYGYVLDHGAGSYQRLATFSSGQSGIMDLAFDRETGTLWADCDATCGNRMTLLDVDTTMGSATKGRFVVHATVSAPSSIRTFNNEGITMAPESECTNGQKSFFWADDDETNGYAIRRGTIACGRLF